MKKFAICLALCLLCLLAVSCTGGGGHADTTVPDGTDAPTEVPTETPTEAPTEAPAEAPKGGCGSVMGLSLLPCLSCVLFFRKKRES